MIYVEGSFFYVHFLNIFSRILSKDERQTRKSSVSYLRWPGVLTDVLNWEKSPTFGPRERTRRITDFRFQKTVTRNLMQKTLHYLHNYVVVTPALPGKREKYYLRLFFTNRDKEKSQTQFLTVQGDQEAAHLFRNTGCCCAAKNKTHFVKITVTWKWLVHELFLRSWKSRPLFREIINLTVDTFQDFQGICCWCLEYTCTQ